MLSFHTTLLLAAGILGLCVGSFLNVVIHRLPRMMERDWSRDLAETLRHLAGLKETPDSDKPALNDGAQALERVSQRRFSGTYNLVLPHSTCPHCGHRIRAWENIPVLSFLFLRGRCSACKAPISWRYPAVELLTGTLSVLAAVHFGYSLQLAGALILIWFLVALTMIDLDTQMLPDSLTLPLLWLGLLFNIVHTWVPLSHAVLGAAAGYLLLWSVYWIFKLLRNKEGMGYGDFKLLGALGAWLGLLQLPLIILAAAVSGLVFALSQMLFARLGWEQRIPFGPYLAAGGLLALFFGDAILRWYLVH